MSDCLSSVDRVDGRTATGKEEGVVTVVAVAGEEEEEGFGVVEKVKEVDSAVGMEVAEGDLTEEAVVEVVDTEMEDLVEETTSQEEGIEETGEEEEDTRQIETSQPPMARLGTSFHSAIHMFTQKTADFYRYLNFHLVVFYDLYDQAVLGPPV